MGQAFYIVTGWNKSTVQILPAADGKHVLFSEREPEQDAWELYRIPLEGGEAQKLGLKMKSGFMNLSAHPYGRSIAFSSAKRNAEFWVMENFLPKSKVGE